MPDSKRNKIVHLTKVKKKGKDHKEELIKQLRELCANYKHLYVFDFDQIKSAAMMRLRVKLKSRARIFSGKNSLVVLVLKELSQASGQDFGDILKHVSGNKSLLFASLDRSELLAELEPEFGAELLLGHALIRPAQVGSAKKKKNNNKVLKSSRLSGEPDADCLLTAE